MSTRTGKNEFALIELRKAVKAFSSNTEYNGQKLATGTDLRKAVKHVVCIEFGMDHTKNIGNPATGAYQSAKAALEKELGHSLSTLGIGKSPEQVAQAKAVALRNKGYVVEGGDATAIANATNALVKREVAAA